MHLIFCPPCARRCCCVTARPPEREQRRISGRAWYNYNLAMLHFANPITTPFAEEDPSGERRSVRRRGPFGRRDFLQTSSSIDTYASYCDELQRINIKPLLAAAAVTNYNESKENQNRGPVLKQEPGLLPSISWETKYPPAKDRVFRLPRNARHGSCLP